MNLDFQISQVGGSNKNECDFLYIKNSNKKELWDGVLNLISKSNILKLTIFPNFEFGWLTGPKGLVAKLHEKNAFSKDLFLGEKFRVITIVECNLKSSDWNKEREKDFERCVRRCFPIETHSPPGLQDQDGSSWGMSLGKRGCMIGLYTFKDLVDGRDRYFFLCHSSLPDYTLNEMNEYDQEIDNDNYNIMFNLKSTTKNSLQVETYNSMFNRQSLNNRMLKIAKENNKRLIIYLSQITDIPLRNKQINYFHKTDLGEEEPPNSNILYKKGCEYRVPMNLEQKIGNVELMVKGLEWWPSGALILKNTVLPKYKYDRYATEECKKDYIKEELSEYPLGLQLWDIKKKDQERFKKLQKKYDIKFESRPQTLQQVDVECDYNTFRTDNYNNVQWFSNCTSTNKSHGGVCTQLPLEIGYEIIYPSFLNRGGKTINFTNQHDNAYPVVFPFKKDLNKKCERELLDKFFTKNYGGISKDYLTRKPPNQLLGQYLYLDKHKEPAIQNTLLPKKDENFKKIILHPLKVFLSDDEATIPRFELKLLL